MKKLLLTGGGTAGHVTPNIALIGRLKNDPEGYEFYYIGSKDGIEKQLIEDIGIKYYGIATGKFRRYFSLKNFTDPFRVIKGYFQAKKFIKQINPDVCFSKGGFVSVPVVFAAKKRKVPTIIHESDMTPGLANKLAIPKAKKVCTNFPETAASIKKGRGVHTGSPIREELFTGSREAGLKYAGFDGSKPVLLVVGGSLGAKSVNEAIRNCLEEITKQFDIIHLCGKGKADEAYNNKPGYIQIEYCDKEMKDVFAAADIVVSRAGANAIFELLALKKPNILIPLSAEASRGDQILNAESFKKQGFSMVLQDKEVNNETLLNAINELWLNKEKFIDTMDKANKTDAISIIIDLIKKVQK